MRKIVAQKLTHEAFAPFGTFYDFMNPSGYGLPGNFDTFYPDRLTETFTSRIGFSGITVKKPEKYIIDKIEYHTSTCEMMIPLNDDMLFHVAPASNGKLLIDQTQAFIVPKGTLIKFDTGIWHLCPWPAHEDELKCMIILPTGIYMNDCKVFELGEEDQFEIVLPE